jgi:hypothetical protein
MSAGFAVLASVAAFISAGYWCRASRSSYVPSSIEPGDEMAAQQWLSSSLLSGSVKSSAMNSRAAGWSALTAALFGVSGIFGAAAVIF